MSHCHSLDLKWSESGRKSSTGCSTQISSLIICLCMFSWRLVFELSYIACGALLSTQVVWVRTERSFFSNCAQQCGSNIWDFVRCNTSESGFRIVAILNWESLRNKNLQYWSKWITILRRKHYTHSYQEIGDRLITFEELFCWHKTVSIATVLRTNLLVLNWARLRKQIVILLSLSIFCYVLTCVENQTHQEGVNGVNRLAIEGEKI